MRAPRRGAPERTQAHQERNRARLDRGGCSRRGRSLLHGARFARPRVAHDVEGGIRRSIEPGRPSSPRRRGRAARAGGAREIRRARDRDRGAQRGALRGRRAQTGARRAPLHPPWHHARRGGARALAERGGTPPLAERDGCALRRPARVDRAHARDRRGVHVLDARAEIQIPLRDARGRDRGLAPAQDDVRGREEPLRRRRARQSARADREGAPAHRAARGRDVFLERARDRRHRARARHPLSGARERGEQRGLLLPRNHRGRSGAELAPLRALPLGRAQGAARHRRRFRARATRRGDPGNLSEVRARSRGDGERGHLLPRKIRAARGRQGVRLLARASRSALVDRDVVGQAR